MSKNAYVNFYDYLKTINPEYEIHLPELSVEKIKTQDLVETGDPLA